jgi:hypothetical protein
MWTNVQFTGNLPANGTGRWFTWGWPPAWHVVWYMMPTTPQPGAPQIGWDVAVENANAGQSTYWITVRNLSGAPMDFEARYAVLS